METPPILTVSIQWIFDNIGAVIEFIGTIVGAFMIICQVGFQHRKSLKLQKENMKEQLRLEIYKELSKKIERCDSTLGTALVKSITVPILLEESRMMQSKTQSEPEPIIKETANSILNCNSQISKHFGLMLCVMEKYEIALPNLSTLRHSMNKQHDLIIESFRSFYHAVLPFLPIDTPDDLLPKFGKKRFMPPLPNDVQMKELNCLANEYGDACNKLFAYNMDLRIEAQHNLLGSLFEHKLPPRSPLEPNYSVLTADKDPLKSRTPGRVT